MSRIANPYGVQTPIGQGLRALSTMALTRRDNADKQALYDYQADMYGAHSALYDAQRRKTDAELAALDANARARSPEALDEAVALRYGVPTANVRAMRDFAGGAVPMAPALPPGVNRDDVGRTMYALRTGLMDRTSNAAEVALAEGRLAEADARRGVVGGTVNPTRLRQAYGTGPVYSQNAQGSVLNTVEGGVDQTNPLAVASVASERAQANQRNAAAGASASLMRQRDIENKNGIKLGPPVLVQDPEVGATYTSPLSAPGRAPAAKPTDRSEPLVPVVRDGQTVYVPRSEAAGEVVPTKPVSQPKPQTVRGLTGAQAKALESAVDEQFPGMAKEDRSAIIARATAEATNPASPTYMNPAGSVGAVMSGVEVEDNTFSKNRIKDRAGFATGGRPLTAPPVAAPRPAAPAPAPAPGANLKGIVGSTPPAGAVPPPAQRVVGSVYETPRGPMKWTGTGWVPSGT